MPGVSGTKLTIGKKNWEHENKYLNALKYFSQLAIFNDKQMEDEAKVHDIFLIDPIEQVDFTHKKAKIILENGNILAGIIYTVDPVSQSVILACREEKDDKFSVKIVLKSSIKQIEVSTEAISINDKFDLNNIFITDGKPPVIEVQKEKVKQWLEKNLIPVIEEREILKVESLEIHPPYGPNQCFSSSLIILSRIQKLLKEMPV